MWLVSEETYMPRLETRDIWVRGTRAGGSSGLCCTSVFCDCPWWACLFLVVSYPMPKEPPNPGFALLVHMGPVFFTDGGVCVS